jgi:hypothetical protein
MERSERSRRRRRRRSKQISTTAKSEDFCTCDEMDERTLETTNIIHRSFWLAVCVISFNDT